MLYLATIFSIQHWMKDREPFKLQIPVAVHYFAWNPYGIVRWRLGNHIRKRSMYVDDDSNFFQIWNFSIALVSGVCAAVMTQEYFTSTFSKGFYGIYLYFSDFILTLFYEFISWSDGQRRARTLINNNWYNFATLQYFGFLSGYHPTLITRQSTVFFATYYHELSWKMCKVASKKLHIMRTFLSASLCSTRDTFYGGNTGRAVFVLIFARLPEFIDTIFIVRWCFWNIHDLATGRLRSIGLLNDFKI